jgi:nitric oxide reductase activation protein|tara:strand:+ start:1683 stop:2000 length:318 start_codon:yes stop_codon:yes gene_type:complete
MIDAMWDAFTQIEDQIRLELLESEDGSKEEERANSLEGKLETLGQVLGRVEGVLDEPKDAIIEPDVSRVRMWLDDLSELNQKLNSAHGMRVTLDEVIEHLKQWDV